MVSNKKIKSFCEKFIHLIREIWLLPVSQKNAKRNAKNSREKKTN